MNFLTNIWNWFDGKKTNIGAAILTLAFVLTQVDTQVVVAIWHMQLPTWFAPFIQTLEWAGTAFSGVGLLHKANKS